jgi:hypothetical protein
MYEDKKNKETKLERKQVMKNSIKTMGIALMMVAGLSACKKDYPVPTPRPTATVATSGVWMVASMQENGVEYKDKFATYQFRFEKSGLAVAMDRNVKNEGKWSSGATRERVSFVMQWHDNHELLRRLSSDWTVVKQTPTTLEMRDISNDADGQEYLLLKKL